MREMARPFISSAPYLETDSPTTSLDRARAILLPLFLSPSPPRPYRQSWLRWTVSPEPGRFTASRLGGLFTPKDGYRLLVERLYKTSSIPQSMGGSGKVLIPWPATAVPPAPRSCAHLDVAGEGVFLNFRLAPPERNGALFWQILTGGRGCVADSTVATVESLPCQGFYPPKRQNVPNLQMVAFSRYPSHPDAKPRRHFRWYGLIVSLGLFLARPSPPITRNI